MKLLALADRRISESLPDLIERESIELVLLLGDLKFIDICDLVDAKIPIIGVYGNHCISDYMAEIHAMNAHLKLCSVKGFNIFGFEGCPYYKGEDHEFSQEEANSLIGSNSPKCDILIAHSPASGINSSHQAPHQGFEALKQYLEVHSPKYFFHCHSYPPESQKISRFNKTIIYWVSGAEVIDLELLAKGIFLKSQPY